MGVKSGRSLFLDINSIKVKLPFKDGHGRSRVHLRNFELQRNYYS